MIDIPDKMAIAYIEKLKDLMKDPDVFSTRKLLKRGDKYFYNSSWFKNLKEREKNNVKQYGILALINQKDGFVDGTKIPKAYLDDIESIFSDEKIEEPVQQEPIKEDSTPENNTMISENSNRKNKKEEIKSNDWSRSNLGPDVELEKNHKTTKENIPNRQSQLTSSKEKQRDQKQKKWRKVIAREFLILLGSIILVIAAVSFLNYMGKSKKAEREDLQEEMLGAITSSFEDESFDQEYFEEVYQNNSKTEGMSYDEFLNEAEKLILDSFDFNLDTYYTREAEWNNLEGKADKISSVLRTPSVYYYWERIDDLNDSIWMNNKDNSLTALLIILGSVYIVRPLIFAVQWSIKTLKE